MRQLSCPLLLCLILLFTSCLPFKEKPVTPPPAPPRPAAPPAATAGPYWHGKGGAATLADALAYYTALKTLKRDELSHEQERLAEAVDTNKNRLARLQSVLLAALPEQTFIDPDEAIEQLAMTRQDAEFHRDLANLLILLDDLLSSRQATQEQSKGEERRLRVARKRLNAKDDELETCLAEQKELAGKLRQLQEIERGLLDRERKR